MIFQEYKVEEAVACSDLVITGEGSYDKTTKAGKLVQQVSIYLPLFYLFLYSFIFHSYLILLVSCFNLFVADQRPWTAIQRTSGRVVWEEKRFGCNRFVPLSPSLSLHLPSPSSSLFSPLLLFTPSISLSHY